MIRLASSTIRQSRLHYYGGMVVVLLQVESVALLRYVRVQCMDGSHPPSNEPHKQSTALVYLSVVCLFLPTTSTVYHLFASITSTIPKHPTDEF